MSKLWVVWMLFEWVILKGIFSIDALQVDVAKWLWMENIYTCKLIFQQLNISHSLLSLYILAAILFEA